MGAIPFLVPFRRTLAPAGSLSTWMTPVATGAGTAVVGGGAGVSIAKDAGGSVEGDGGPGARRRLTRTKTPIAPRARTTRATPAIKSPVGTALFFVGAAS